MTSRKSEMKKQIGTFHQWYYDSLMLTLSKRHVNDELNLIWTGWFLWVTDWHFEQIKHKANLKG